jgi:hypothetical protein
MNNEIEFQVVRTDRKSVSIQIKPDGQVVVRAPKKISDRELMKIVKSREAWIYAHLEKLKQSRQEMDKTNMLSAEEIRQLADQALKVIPERVKYYAPLIGVDYGNITIRNQRTRWGSCSSKGNLNFNCLLMLTPPEVIDSVVVHELCHRKEMNHSRKFYQEIYRVYPEYDKWNQWLKQHGSAIMSRMIAK